MSRTLDRSQGKFEAMPVSEGAPIVESGSNADGEFTKLADGTLICRVRKEGAVAVNTAEGSIFKSITQTWVLPVACIPDDTIVCFGSIARSDSFWLNVTNNNHISVTTILLSAYSSAASVTKYYVAVIGRWK